MWDKLLAGRTVNPRYAPKGSVSREGWSREPGPSPADGDGPGRGRAVPFGVTTCVAELLRASYAELVREPVPERFVHVLQGLTEPSGQAGGLDASGRISDLRRP